MRDKDNSELIVYGIVAVIAAVIIYCYWQFILGALAIVGFVVILNHFNRNKNPPH